VRFFVVAAVTKEVKVEDYFKLAVERRGGEADKFVTPGRVGAQDRIVFWPADLWPDAKGQVHFVELKRPNGGRIRPAQKRLQERRLRQGFVSIICKTFSDVDNYMAHYAPKVKQ
jgi:hypothetical protein